MELEAAQKEARNASTELFKLKNSVEETVDQLGAIKRENKNLQDEVHELQGSIQESGRAIHDLDKAKRDIENDRNELQVRIAFDLYSLQKHKNMIFICFHTLFSG